MADIIAILENRNGDTLYPIAGSLVNDSITTDMLKDNVVSTFKITNLAVTTDKIAGAAVTTGKLADKAVTPAKIDTVESATTVVDAQYSDATKRTHIPDLSFLSFWDGSYNGTNSNIAHLANNAVITSNITNLNVTTAKIANGAVTWGKLSSSSFECGRSTVASKAIVAFSASHSAAPSCINITPIGHNSAAVAWIAVYDVTATGFKVSKTYYNGNTFGDASEPFYWQAIWK